MYLSRDNSDASQSNTTTDDSSSTTTSTLNNSTPPKEPVVPQRVTRSSQRFAQQNGDNNESKSNNNNNGAEHDNGDENNSSSTAVANNSDRQTSDQSGRKAKRKKLEQQVDSEQDANQQSQQPPMLIPEFCPSDYQLPEFNSFELYRRQMKKRYKEIMCLNSVQAVSKAPSGIKDYLLFNGPYLLEGDKLGVGLGGASIERSSLGSNQQVFHHYQQQQQLPRLKKKFSQTQSGAFKLLSTPQHQLANNHKLNAYNVPKLMKAPASLATNSPLYELFQSQEKARHKMRMQHLKERERSILATEQEILRAYNQEYNLSACVYFHHQEKYHYVHENEGVCENLDYPTVATAAPATAAVAPESEAPSQDTMLISASSPSSQQTEKDDDAQMMAADDSPDTVPTTPTSATPEQKVITKLVKDLQELDDKWAEIKREMFIRHKNESDTLYAVQSLEWEWRAKETGAFDKEFVPRVEVSALDY